MPIDKFFHFMHIVDDFDAAAERYGALLAPDVWGPKHWSDFDKRWALLGTVGPDFVLEIMEPSKDEADFGSPLPKFRQRHGEHLHSFAWYVQPENLVDLATRLGESGVRVVDAYGTLNDGTSPAGKTFFTHPKDTFGQLEFQALGGAGAANRDSHLQPDWTGAYWADEHPLGLLRTSHLTTIVADLDRATIFYEKLLEGEVFHTETADDRLSAFVRVGPETVIELAQPTGTDSRLARDMAEHGELPHAMTFKVRDLDAAERHVEHVGIRIAERSGETITLEPADMFNALVAFTTRQLPGDSRD